MGNHAAPRAGRKHEALKGTAVSKKIPKGGKLLSDGHGLYVSVSRSGARSWILLYHLNGRRHEMGLGSCATFGAAEARKRAAEYRQLVHAGIDPRVHRDAEKAKNLAAAQARKTFSTCASEYIKLHSDQWGETHRAQWENTLRDYAEPVIGNMDINAVAKADILKVLEPIWKSKTETASRVRQRIRAILDWAHARDYRTADTAQLWAQIDASLPKAGKIKKTKHHAAAPYSSIAETIRTIRATPRASDMVKLMSEFLVLTATRTSEVLGATWSEIDQHARTWTIPATRMKAGREHRVPLSDAALAILERAKAIAPKDKSTELIFPNPTGAEHSTDTINALFTRLGFDFTPHGMRSTFRDWVEETTNTPHSVAEMALAHTVRGQVEAAYRRGDLFDKRVTLMAQWGAYVTGTAS